MSKLLWNGFDSDNFTIYLGRNHQQLHPRDTPLHVSKVHGSKLNCRVRSTFIFRHYQFCHINQRNDSLHGTWLAIQEAKRSRRKVVVVSTSSMNGTLPSLSTVYAASKFGVTGLMAAAPAYIEIQRAAGVPIPEGCRFGSVAPGPVFTPINDRARDLGVEEDVHERRRARSHKGIEALGG